MKTILLYCQYLTGMGHLVRSIEIARALADTFEVHFINGGPPVAGFQYPPHIHLESLPALWLEGGEFQVPAGYHQAETVKAMRKRLLIEIFDRVQPDCLMTEFFPFGRHKLLFELLPLLEHAKATSPQTKIVCSLRDVIGRNTLNQEADTICELVNTFFDLILFHADPNFQRFAESFPRYQELDCSITYTGFVAQSPPQTDGSEYSPDWQDDERLLASLDTDDKPHILVSVGGGRLGFELLEAVVAASPILAQQCPHRMLIFTGPFLPDDQFAQLHQRIGNAPNMTLRRFTPQLLRYMEKAALSISLTGYNTTMNILKTGVRSLVVPIGHYDQDHEQLIRTHKLADLGVVEVIQPSQLEPHRLAQRIQTSLNRLPNQLVSHLFDLHGAETTASVLQALLANPSINTTPVIA